MPATSVALRRSLSRARPAPTARDFHCSLFPLAEMGVSLISDNLISADFTLISELWFEKVPKVLKMPKVLEVAVLSDQITPLTLYPRGAQGHFKYFKYFIPARGTRTLKLVTGQNP